MTRGITLFTALCICLMMVTPGVAQEGMPEMTPEQMKAMQAWMEAGTPGEHHAWIAKMSGDWKTSTKSWWEPAEEPSMTSEGTSTTEMIWDGRYAHMNSTSHWADMKMHGQGFMGYDNIKKEYFTTWMDNMSTGFFMARGQREGDKLVCHGTMDDPATGEMDKPARLEWEIVSPDKVIFRIYDNAGTENEYLMMEETSMRVTE